MEGNPGQRAGCAEAVARSCFQPCWKCYVVVLPMDKQFLFSSFSSLLAVLPWILICFCYQLAFSVIYADECQSLPAGVKAEALLYSVPLSVGIWRKLAKDLVSQCSCVTEQAESLLQYYAIAFPYLLGFSDIKFQSKRKHLLPVYLH